MNLLAILGSEFEFKSSSDELGTEASVQGEADRDELFKLLGGMTIPEGEERPEPEMI